MKKLNVEKMENVSGGGLMSLVVCASQMCELNQWSISFFDCMWICSLSEAAA